MKKTAAFILTCSITVCLHAQLSLVKSDLYAYDFITTVNGKLLFFATDELDYNYELWTSDGTDAGTAMLLDITGNADGSILDNSYWGPQFLDRMPTVYNDELYFLANDGPHGMEIWKTDGTAAGTKMLKDIYPGPNGFFSPYFYYPYFTEMDGTLYFSANDGVHGWELWKTDGTEEGTEMVVDISADNVYGSNPDHLINFNGTLIFTARDDVYGYEISKSDGTAAGTELIKDIVPGINGAMNNGYANSIDPQFTVSGDYLYFVGRLDETLPVMYYLYRTDGTDAGTMTLNNDLQSISNFCDIAGTCYFYAFDGDYEHSSLWKSDGTPGGTDMVITDGIAASTEGRSFYNFNNKLYFYGYTTDFTAYGLAKSDGTEAGTEMVYSFEGLGSIPTVYNFNSDGSSPYFFYHALKKISESAMSVRMVQTNGTTDGTIVYAGAQPFRSTTFLDGDLYFPGIDSTADETWGLYKIHPMEMEEVAINETELPSAFTIYPNPVSSVVMFQLTEAIHNARISIYDMQGERIYFDTVSAMTYTINVDAWPEGIYVVSIDSGEKNYTHSMVIVNDQ